METKETPTRFKDRTHEKSKRETFQLRYNTMREHLRDRRSRGLWQGKGERAAVPDVEEEQMYASSCYSASESQS